jgi:bifunctional enzyme CysN/CysC
MLVEQKLLEKGVPAYVLDGDNLRHGLNADLGFSMADRAENQRRLAHVAAILADSGQVVLVPAISPLEEHRGGRNAGEQAVMSACAKWGPQPEGRGDRRL